ncbi:MAG: Crp/Fnr family transcriptional regulator [Thiomonas sp. 20-64-5]|nr:MAG: Crp/Fnr family transcriptional regulator [Thiomonas sp. 20-64-5]
MERLPRTERRHLLALCEPVELVFRDVLCVPGQQTLHAYFPVDGFVSLLQQTDAHPPLEVAMVGSEGMLGAEMSLGVMPPPLLGVVQGSGRAWRVEQDVLQRLLLQHPVLRQSLQRYVYVLVAQLAAAVVCQRFHLIGARLARRLLMSQDRAHADRLHVTHEGLAQMLGTRRVGVTEAAGELQRSGLIAYHRGELQVLDRAGLLAIACSCYGRDLLIYDTSMACAPRSRMR